MEKGDLLDASLVHEKAFVRQKLSFEWLECNLNAFPRLLSFVAEIEDSIVGYIIWSQKSGFRPILLKNYLQKKIRTRECPKICFLDFN